MLQNLSIPQGATIIDFSSALIDELKKHRFGPEIAEGDILAFPSDARVISAPAGQRPETRYYAIECHNLTTGKLLWYSIKRLRCLDPRGTYADVYDQVRDKRFRVSGWDIEERPIFDSGYPTGETREVRVPHLVRLK